MTTMSLPEALSLLARVHTGDDPLTGFQVHMGATPQWGHVEYVAAWRAVREAAHLRVEPEQYPKAG